MTRQTNKLLSKKEKIQKLSDEAIKDIYSRYHFLKLIDQRKRKRFNQPLTERDKEFKQISLHNEEEGIFYQALRKFMDVNGFSDLKKKTESLEIAYFNKVTNDDLTEKEKIQIAKKKLIETSKCCGVPKAVFVHKAVEEYSDLENI